jgi:reductive dehalogenase
VPRYEGTPEENTLMMACISRYVGGTQTSFSELDERGRKFMWKRNSLVYDDGPAFHPYYDEAARQYHIPKALRYMVNPIIQQDIGGTRRPPTNYSGLNVGKGYFQSALANIRLHAFIRTLGWHSYGANSAGFNTAYAVMSGAGEVLRLHEACSPFVGPLFRRANMFLTDLPLVATTPIDSGIAKFCESCTKCAEQCPTQAIPYHKEPIRNRPGISHRLIHPVVNRTFLIPRGSTSRARKSGSSTCTPVGLTGHSRIPAVESVREPAFSPRPEHSPSMGWLGHWSLIHPSSMAS